MKLKYAPKTPPDNLSTEDSEVYEKIKQRRGKHGILPLDLALLHSPKIANGPSLLFFFVAADICPLSTGCSISHRRYMLIRYLGWNELLGAVRTKSSLPDDLREISICRVAILNRAWFEWGHHAPLLTSAPGFTEEQFSVVKQLNPRDQGPLSDRQWAVLQYSDAMTKEVEVPEHLFEQLRKVGFGEKEIVEITVTCATYNMVSRFLVALDVGECNGAPPPDVATS